MRENRIIPLLVEKSLAELHLGLVREAVERIYQSEIDKFLFIEGMIGKGGVVRYLQPLVDIFPADFGCLCDAPAG